MSASTGGASGLDPALLAVLACPGDDHGALRVEESTDGLVCTVCERRFRVQDGIPVLLLDD